MRPSGLEYVQRCLIMLLKMKAEKMTEFLTAHFPDFRNNIFQFRTFQDQPPGPCIPLFSPVSSVTGLFLLVSLFFYLPYLAPPLCPYPGCFVLVWVIPGTAFYLNRDRYPHPYFKIQKVVSIPVYCGSPVVFHLPIAGAVRHSE